MAQYLPLPDGSSVTIREGESPQTAWARAQQMYPEAFKTAAPETKPESGFIPSIKRGAMQTGMLLGDVLPAMAGRAVGANEYADRQLAEAAATQKEIQAKYPSAVPSFTDIKGGGDLVTYITEAVGEAIPSLIPGLFTGGAAAVLGRGAVAAAKEAAEKAALSSVAKGVAKEEAEKIAMQAGVQAARSAALKYQATGAVAGSAAQNVPDVFQNILEETGKEDLGAALVGGGFNAVLDAVLPVQLLRKARMSGIPESEIIGAWYKRGAAGLGKGFLVEGGTEAVQEMSSAAAVKFVDNNKDFFTKENFVKFIDAGLKGGLGGGVISGASDIAFGRSDQAAAEESDLKTALKQREEDAKKREQSLTTPEGRFEFVQDYEARQARFQELKDIAKPGKDSTPLQQAEYAEVKKEKNDLGRGLYRDSAEYKKALPIAQELKEKQRVGAMTPLEYQMEQFGVDLGPETPEAAPATPSEQQFNFSTLSDFTPPPKQETTPPVNRYVAQQLQLANRDLYTTPEAADYVEYLMQNPALAAQITTETPMPGLSNAVRSAVTGAITSAIKLQTDQQAAQARQQAKQSLQPRVEDLAGQIPKKVVGKRKAPDYDAYLQDLETLDFDRREGQTDADVAQLAKLQRPTDVTDQGEMFGQPSQQTVLGEAPKTQRELFADLRIARAAGDREAAASIIDSLRVVQRNDDAAAEKAKSSQQRFVLSGEQREELSAKGLSEAQIDELETEAQKPLGRSLGAGEMPLATALQQMASASRADAFSEVVDLVNRFNKGAAKQEQLNAAKEKLVSGLLMDIRQSRREPLTDEETRGITRNANALLRELTERFGDTRSLSQKGDNFVPAQTSTGEFRTDEVPGMGFPTVESRMPGRQTFSSPFAAAQSIREGLEELRTRAITGAQPATYTRTATPNEVSDKSAELQLRRELAKDPETHSAEQRSLLVDIADNLRMLMRPETRQDVSSWLYDLARDPGSVPADKTQAIRNALQVVEQAKLSNQDQLGLPLGPGKKLRQEAPETEGKPTPVKEGSFSQVSFEPEYEDVTSPVFNSYAQLKQYLASDALQEIRSALGLGRPTADRLEQRLKPFATRVALYMSRLNALQTRADELNKRVQELQVSKRGQLTELKAMSATDMAQETQALNEARRNLAELRTRMSELEAPLRKELEPILKEFETAQKQFDAAVAAEEKLTAAMLNNNRLFGDRELAALQKLMGVQQRMKNARSKLYKEFEADFGSDPRNLARMMREFKDSGKQGAFTEQLAAAHKELYDVFFDTRKDDTATHQYLKTAAKLDAQIQIQAAKIDAMGEKLLNAGLKLEVIRDSQVEVAENRDEILDAKQQTQDAQQALKALEAKQRERLDALEKLEAELGLTRTEIPHRVTETTTVAEVLRAANDSEKALIQQRIEAEAELNKAAAPVRALFYFDGQRATARAKKPETAAQTQDRDAQRQRLLEAIGRDPASFEGQRISFEKRRALAEEFRTEKARREELEALIAASDEAVPYVRQQIAEAEKTLKSIDQEIAQVEAANKKRPRSFQAKLEQQSAMVALGPLREARARFAKGIERFTADIATYEREKATAQSNLATLEDRTAELAALFSADPEVQKARTEAIDARIAKVEKNITNQTAKLQEKGIKASTRDSRERELRKSRKELQRLTAQRSAKYGIVRTSLADVGRPEDAVAEEGERLGARKAGPVVRPTRTAGNIRTGTLETAGERTLSTRSKITQSGATKTETSGQVQAVGNAAAAERAAAQPEKTATQLAVQEVQQQQQILAAKERLETGIRTQLADLDIRLSALRRSQRPNATLIGDLEAQKQAMQRELVAARLDVEREGALAAEAQKIVDTTSTVGGILGTSYPGAVADASEETVPDDTAEALQTGLKSLSKDEVKTLETAYGAKKRSDKFLAKLQKDVVDMVNNAGKNVAKGIRNIVKKLSEGVLAVAMIFNPQFNATNFSFDLPQAYSQTITETANIKAQVPASAREQMSPLAQMVYENMAPAAKVSGKGFGIVDKPNGAIHFFNKDGSLLVQGPALMGKDVGDVMGKSSFEGGPKITPAGKFTLEFAPSEEYGSVLRLAESKDSTGYVAIHSVYLGDIKENRLGRLASPDATDNRISYGCINTTQEMYTNALAPNADALNGGMLLVLPDVTENTAQMFPEQVQTVTKTFSGTEQTAKTEGRSVVGREEKLAEDRTLYRVSRQAGAGLEVDAVANLAERITSQWALTPDIKVVATENDLPLRIRGQIQKDEASGQIPGLYDPKTNTVYLVASNLPTANDVALTLAHEVAGHFGLRSLLGAEYAAEMSRLYSGNKTVKAQADAKLKATPSLNRNTATEEVLAGMAEQDPNAQGPGPLRSLYNAVRDWFRRMFGQTVSDKEVQQVVANARRQVIKGGVDRVTEVDSSEPLYRIDAKYSSPEWTSAGQDIRKVIAGQRSWGDKIKANATGLAFETQLVDRFAAFERLRKYMPEQMGTQMMYYLRMYDQRMNFVSQAVSNGALRLVEKIRPDGKKEYVIESKEGANIGNVVQILRGAQQHIGNAEAVNQAFTTYLAARRAERVTLDKLNFGGSVTQDMLDRTMRLVNGNDKLKDVFEKARREYNNYNRDQIAMVASTGAISKETEASLTRSEDYIPFYRAQNGVVELLIGGEAPMRIGSIADQPYLQELVGGDQPILDFMTSSVQNTNMLVDMALRNLATKNAVFELVSLGAAKIVAGKPAGRDVVQFKVDGQDRYAVVASETVTIGGKTFETGVPADILVKGMEGIPTQMPFLFRAMAMPAQLLRKAVTLSPLYQAKALFRDSLAAPILAGANFTPVLGALRQIGKESGKTLEQRGITGGQYMTGTTDDLTKILRDIADGKPGWMTALSKAEAIGMKADALTRRAQYNSYIEQGLSEMEATLMALESMNFNKRGASPSIHVANALIPFFNAQIQGLNVMYKAMSGQMPFNDKLKIQQKLLIRGGMMAAVTLLYAALMEDDEAYKNSPPAEKYGNWFVRIPGVDQPIRVPIPFEIGYIFKALPEAIYNSMTDKNGGEDAVKAFKQILLQSVPGGSSYGIPQIMKPAIEAGLGKSFYTGRDILSAREKELLPEEQFRANTAEISKVVGQTLGISPVVMENLVRGYTGTMGLAFLHAVSLGAPKSESPEAAAKRLSDYPIIGGAFQPNDAGGITNTVYERFNEDIKVRNSYKKMLEEGRAAEANALLQRRGNELLEAEIGDVFKQNMNTLTQAERAIAASTMTPEQKRKQLDELRKLKTAISQTMRTVADKAVKLSSPL